MNFCDRLKQLKSEHQVTQKEIAKAANISDRAYRNLESGVSVPNMDTLIAIADFYHVSIDYLCGRTDNPKFPKAD